MTFTVQEEPLLYVVAVQVPPGAAWKSLPLAPCVSTPMLPTCVLTAKLNETGIVELLWPTFTEPKFGVTLFTVTLTQVVAVS